MSHPLKFTTDSNNSMGKSVSHRPVCLSGVSASEGRERVQNEPHDHRPRTPVTESNIDRADTLIHENRRITIKELGAMLVQLIVELSTTREATSCEATR